MLTRALLGLGLTTGLLLAATPVAHAGLPVTCGPGRTWVGQRCQVVATDPGSGGSPSDDAPPRGSGPAPTCSFFGAGIPCQDDDWGWWSASRDCYVRLASPQPDTSDGVWGGASDGAIYECGFPAGLGVGGLVYTFWSATAPAGPDPAVLAQTAVESMNLRAISIGIVPDDAPGSVGLVGMPVWLWAEGPDARSWGPVTRTASASGVTVTATAKVQRVRWLMGDGGVVVCTSPGTEYQDRFGNTDSPTCGYSYSQQGTYTVRAESQWSVSWSGMGQSGTIPVLLTDSTTITVGELQVITTG